MLNIIQVLHLLFMHRIAAKNVLFLWLWPLRALNKLAGDDYDLSQIHLICDLRIEFVHIDYHLLENLEVFYYIQLNIIYV